MRSKNQASKSKQIRCIGLQPGTEQKDNQFLRFGAGKLGKRFRCSLYICLCSHVHLNIRICEKLHHVLLNCISRKNIVKNQSQTLQALTYNALNPTFCLLQPLQFGSCCKGTCGASFCRNLFNSQFGNQSPKYIAGNTVCQNWLKTTRREIIFRVFGWVYKWTECFQNMFG